MASYWGFSTSAIIMMYLLMHVTCTHGAHARIFQPLMTMLVSQLAHDMSLCPAEWNEKGKPYSLSVAQEILCLGKSKNVSKSGSPETWLAPVNPR